MIIVTLTSYGERLKKLPLVLQTILQQTVAPDKIVLNLAKGETLPGETLKYLNDNNIEIFYTNNTKVYKKVIPTLRRYPDDIVICIDDDILYPPGMIEEFVQIHQVHPNFPISGNKTVIHGVICHCGCASLVKAAFFGDFLERLDCQELLRAYPCDDVVYTYFCTKSGHPYIQTKNTYFLNLPQLYPDEGYSLSLPDNSICESFERVCHQYGPLLPVPEAYAEDERLSQVIHLIYADLASEKAASDKEIERLKGTYSYRIGKCMLKPISWLKSLGNSSRNKSHENHHTSHT